jgi:hypothetical protein
MGRNVDGIGTSRIGIGPIERRIGESICRSLVIGPDDEFGLLNVGRGIFSTYFMFHGAPTARMYPFANWIWRGVFCTEGSAMGGEADVYLNALQ